MKYSGAIEIAHRWVELDGICHSIGAIDYSTMSESDNNVSTGGLLMVNQLDELRDLNRVLDLARRFVSKDDCVVWCRYRMDGGKRVPDKLRAQVALVDAAVETAARERGLM